MPTEQLILRRVFPVPVTFADLRAARDDSSCYEWVTKDPRTVFTATLKRNTGALDEVYAVIDGHEVRVAIVIEGARGLVKQMLDDSPRMNERINDLLDEASRAGYWQRPHEVRVDLEESQMSHRTMARIAGNSIIAAGGK